jgi:hypothetical protein
LTIDNCGSGSSRDIAIVPALQNKNKLNQRIDIPGGIYSSIESANALDCAENGAEAPYGHLVASRMRGAEWEAEAKQT